MRISSNWNTHEAQSYNLVTGPTTTPISLAEVKDFLKLDASDISEDSFLTLLIESAVDFAEKYIKRDFINKTYVTYRNKWADYFEIRRSKLQSITSVKYYNGSDVLSTVSSSIYAHTDEVDFSRLYTSNGNDWPTGTLSCRLQPIEITFVAGYGSSASDVPAELRRALLEHVLVLYENRGDCEGASCSNKLGGAVRAIYNQYRILDINGNRHRGVNA